MARSHARIDVAIWADEDWLALSSLAKLLYVQLLSQPKLTYAGTLDLAAKRWARAHPDHTVTEIRAALSELDAARMLVVDHDTEEVLVRTFIRNDGVYKQPRVLASGLVKAFELESPILRAALAAELRRLPAQVCGTAAAIAADALEAGATSAPEAVNPENCRRTAATTTASDRPGRSTTTHDALTGNGTEPADETAAREADDPPAMASGNPSPKGPGKGSGKGRAKGPGVRGTGKGKSFPLTLGETSFGSAARPRVDARTRETAHRLVAEHVPSQPRKVADRLMVEAAALLAEGITPDQVTAGLRRWSRKRVGAGLLPEMVGEAMRERAAPPPSTADDAMAAALALARKVAEEDGDDTELGRILRTEPDDETALAALLMVGAST